MMHADFDIEILDTPFDPDARKRRIHINDQGRENPLYKVYIYLTGKDLLFVKNVTYHLHESFPRPKITVKRTMNNPNCKLELWMWGVFELKAVVKDRKENAHELKHFMSFDKYLDSKSIKKYKLEIVHVA